jgi:hypothetical protein
VIYEYALQPSLLVNWASNDRDYAEFLREYGLGSPRLVSSFPKQKASKLRRYLLSEGPGDQQSMTAQRYLEIVNKVVESLVLRDGFDCRSDSWIENVKSESERVAFNVVLSESDINSDKSVTPEKMYVPDSIWNHPRQQTITRTSTALTASIKNLLRLSKDSVVIIDTFGWNERAVAAIQSLIHEIFVDRVHSEIPEVCLYYKEKVVRNNVAHPSPAASYVKSQIFDGLHGVEESIVIKVFEVKQIEGNDVFHNRCILTEHGGVSLGHGIDLSNDPNHTDEVKLMEKAIYDKYWQQFVDDNCFKIVSES